MQIIDYETDHQAEILAAAGGQIRDAIDNGWPRIVVTTDRDNPKRYAFVVEFPSYEEAMATSGSAQTQAFAKAMADLCTSGPTFRNLDVSQIIA